MKKYLKIAVWAFAIFSLQACSIFKPGCHCPKFSYQAVSKTPVAKP